MPEAKVKGARKGAAQTKSRRNIPAAPGPKSSYRRWIYVAAGAAVVYLAFLVYTPALGGPFVFDDTFQPYHTPDYTSRLGAWIYGVRPLLMFSYWLNYQVSQAPGGFHRANLIIHLLNGLLIFLVVRKLLTKETTDWILPAFAGLVFVFHPIQTESVSYIAGRSESLSVFLLLSAFAVFLYRRSREVTWKTSLAILALFAAAVATKEHAVVLVGLLLLTDYFWNPGFTLSGVERNWRLYVPITLSAAAGMFVVAKVLKGSTTAGFKLPEFTWYQYFFTECRAFFLYLRLLVWPAGQDLDWDYPASRNILDHGAIFALGAIVALVGLAVYFRKRYPMASYGFLVYVALLAPTSSVVPIRDPVAERRLYLPMIGMLLFAAAWLARMHIDRRKLAAVLSMVIVVLAIATYQRNLLWASDIAIWEDAVRNSPNKQRVHFQLAHTYYINGRCRDAVAQYADAARLEKPDYGLLLDWGLAYDCADNLDQAVTKFREAALLDPKAHVYTQIAMVYAKRSKWPEALDALAEAQRLNANYAVIYYYRGGIRAKTGDFAAAVADYQHALALDPLMEPAREGLAYAQHQLHASR